jgi:hypothetical protein
MELLILLWPVGFIVGIGVLRVRAGLGLWHTLRVFGPGGVGLAWPFAAGLCALLWPITLVVWLARGCPEPRVVFNERAEAREARLGVSV